LTDAGPTWYGWDIVKSRQRRGRVQVSKIRELSKLQVTEREAAAVLGIRLKTFKEILRVDVAAREAWEDGRELGKHRIREIQFRLAERHPQMAIWLGKQILGQSDVSVVEHSGRDGGPIKTLDLSKLDKSQRNDLRQILTAARVKREA